MFVFPNFLIIGSQKAGTTSLYHVLKKHPEIYMPEKKELNFFFKEDEYRRGPKWYAQHFAGSRTFSARGEASPGYICHPDAPRRIHALIPDVKLILIVREPISRAISQYWDNRRHLRETRDFHKCVDLYLSDRYVPGKIGYFSRGVYMRYIQNYLNYFPRSQLLVLVFDDLIHRPADFYRNVFSFLNVDSSFCVDDFSKPFNRSTVWTNPLYQLLFWKPALQWFIPTKLRRLLFWGREVPFSPPPIDREIRRRLEEFYRPWNNELRRFLGRALSGWS